MRYEPASSIIERLGLDDVVQTCGVDKSRPYRWMYSKEVGGTGGTIPQKYIPDLLALAKKKGIKLSAEEFFRVPGVSS